MVDGQSLVGISGATMSPGGPETDMGIASMSPWIGARAGHDTSATDAPREVSRMIVPPPQPVYTLAPDMDEIEGDQRALLDRCLSSLTGLADGLIVTRIGRTHDHHVVEIETAHGPLLLLERRSPSDALTDVRAV